MLRSRRMRAMRSSGTLLCLGSGAAFGAMAVFGKLAYGEGATVGTLLAVRFALAAALFWALSLAAAAPRASCGRCGGRDVGAGLALGALRLRAAGRLLLRRAGAHRRVAAVAAALHVPGDRRRRRGRARPRAPRRAARWPRSALALGGLVLVVAGAGAGALDPLGAALGLARRGRLQRLHPRQRRASPGACGPRVLVGARLHRRGGDADRRLGAARRAASRRADAPPAGAGSPASPSSRRSPRSASSSPACGASGRRPPRSSPRSSRS